MAIKGILGDEIFTERWQKCAANGQRYPFIPCGIEPTEDMITERERREHSTPVYEEQPIVPSAATRLQGFGFRDHPPDYTQLFPENSYQPFQSLDIAANVTVVEDGYDSDLSDDGDLQTKMGVLLRIRRKLRSELRELSRSLPLPIPNVAIAPGGPLFGSREQHRLRRNQVGQQINVLTRVIREERTMLNASKHVNHVRGLNENLGVAQYTRELRRAKAGLGDLLGCVYANRSKYSLSQLPIPRNANDPSRVTSVALMPASHVNMFEPRVIGFPLIMQKVSFRNIKTLYTMTTLIGQVTRVMNKVIMMPLSPILPQMIQYSRTSVSTHRRISNVNAESFAPVTSLW